MKIMLAATCQLQDQLCIVYIYPNT